LNAVEQNLAGGVAKGHMSRRWKAGRNKSLIRTVCSEFQITAYSKINIRKTHETGIAGISVDPNITRGRERSVSATGRYLGVIDQDATAIVYNSKPSRTSADSPQQSQ
jgi:hypothetical protein